MGRRAGVLLGRTRTAEAIDAAVALLAVDGDTLLTSDPSDLAVLVAATGAQVAIARV